MGLERLYPRLGITIPEGETVFSEGDSSDAFYLILEGKVKIVRIRESREIILAVLLKNQFFGEMGAFRHKPRTASAIAATDLKLIKFPSENLLALIKKYPDVGIKILQVLAMRLLKTNKRLDMLDVKNFRVKLLRSLSASDVKVFNKQKLTLSDTISLFDLNASEEELKDFILKSGIGVIMPDGTIKFNYFLKQ